MTENVQTVTTTERETVTSISGTYLNEAGETIYFTATFETSNTFIKTAVDEALSTRLDGEGGFYYDGKWVTNNAFESNWFDAWGPTILVVGGSAVIFLFLFSRMNASVNSSNNKALEFNKSRARREDNSKTKFNDVAGADEEKAELVEVVEYLRNPGKYTKLGAKLPKGILLVGPPGTGKTLLAKAVAGEAGVPFYSISGSDFVEKLLGVGAGRVRDMFKRAKQTAPCLIFIDEIDAVGRQRGAGMGGGNDEREQTLNQLLVELDGFADNSGIIVIAATNRDDVLDPALLRAGRFDRQITVNLPDRRGRAAIFAVHSRNKKIDPEIDFEAISRRTVGFSGADIANIMNEAAILAVRNNRDVVTLKDIDEAIDRRIAGPAKSSKGMSEHEREVVAFHEAGHAVIGLNLPFSDKVQKITIVPRGRTGGHVLMTPEEDRFLMTKNQLEARIIGYLGGRTSEEIFFGDVSTGAQNDIEVATRIARMMVTEYGMSPLGPIQYESNSGSVFLGRDYNSTQKNFSTQVAFEIDKEVRGIIDRAHEQARLILTKNKDQVTLIAKTLLEKETITSEEIAKLILQPTPVEAKKEEEETPKPKLRKKKVTSDA
jgi:cell division protease FtsH